MFFENDNLDNLFLQFIRARGINEKHLNVSKYLNEFKEWLKELESKTVEYALLLDELNFNLDSHELAEVGKQSIDSTIQYTRGTIITPYSNTFDDAYNDRVINGKIIVLNNEPYFIGKYKDKHLEKIISNRIIHTYMTHNPYKKEEINRWYTLHNENKNNIIIGMYGSIHDKDKDKKINNLYNLKEKLDDQITEEYITNGDEYYYIIGSKRKVLNLNYTR